MASKILGRASLTMKKLGPMSSLVMLMAALWFALSVSVRRFASDKPAAGDDHGGAVEQATDGAHDRARRSPWHSR